jgi:hypothetical protein
LVLQRELAWAPQKAIKWACHWVSAKVTQRAHVRALEWAPKWDATTAVARARVWALVTVARRGSVKVLMMGVWMVAWRAERRVG